MVVETTRREAVTNSLLVSRDHLDGSAHPFRHLTVVQSWFLQVAPHGRNIAKIVLILVVVDAAHDITEVPYSDKGEEMQGETGMPFEVTFIAVVGDRLMRDKLTKELKQTPFFFSI
jgi:hypothetical protein